MTTIAPGSAEEREAQQARADAEHVARIKNKLDPGVSRAEGWRRRGPLLPALIFVIVVTQIPFLFTLCYSLLSWNLVRPGSRQFVGLQNYLAVIKDKSVLVTRSTSTSRMANSSSWSGRPARARARHCACSPDSRTSTRVRSRSAAGT